MDSTIDCDHAYLIMNSEQKKPPGGSTIITTFLGLESLLKNYLRRYLTRQQDIEDVVQDVFVRAYESEKKQEIRSPKSYLFRTAKHIALNELTRKSHQLMVYMGDLSELDVIDSKLSGDDALAMQQRLTALNKVIADLPPQCQRVLVMRKIFGFSHKEVAKELKISVKTVEKHLTQGLQRCQGSEKKNVKTPGRDASRMQAHGRAENRAATKRGSDE